MSNKSKPSKAMGGDQGLGVGSVFGLSGTGMSINSKNNEVITGSHGGKALPPLAKKLSLGATRGAKTQNQTPHGAYNS